MKSILFLLVLVAVGEASAAQNGTLIAKPGKFKSLTEPPCSYCSTQNVKGFVLPNDRVLAWTRAAHNGGAIPLRHFISAPRVINDTYGLFFYDPDGGYVAAYQKDYGYEFYGWRNGVMVVRHRDGSLFSALTGEAFQGPQKGKRLTRIPNFLTTWGYWLMLHPESTAYDMYDGKRYPRAALPTVMDPTAKASMGKVDPRLPSEATVLGIESGGESVSFALDTKAARACTMGDVGGKSVAVLWYGRTKSAAAYVAEVDGKPLTLYADSISPETAPFKDKETGTRWTLAGRGIDGPLRGKELSWIDSIQCKWQAWSAEHQGGKLVDTRPRKTLIGTLLLPETATNDKLRALKAAGQHSVVLDTSNRSKANGLIQAAQRVRAAGLGLYYWLEIGRCPELAEAHPEWMASLQGHPEWRRKHPGFPDPKDGETVKCYPWVPVSYAPAFAAHLQRVKNTLAALPKPDGLFLNDLQAAPSACGCGNDLCRWTTDYGPIRTADKLGEDAAAKFVAEVQKLAGPAEVIPVWAPECSEADSTKHGECAGVPCFSGRCWYSLTEQLGHVDKVAPRLAAAGFVRSAPPVKVMLNDFERIPPMREGKGISSERWIAVIPGQPGKQAQAQAKEALSLGAAGAVVVETKIDQSWKPKIIKATPSRTSRR